ncbi:amino acid ABC transporter substrate-binding protein [Marispirochaeta sp.]|jgi:polar amino acid transport system substrate-binding protein|uniref:amino acid ABC transporter substrate-binding protein n=1 Tax=Marispirochaeta sp. TaxID=2038653 RepID=UPI0029C96D4A|nr:amino acid ABC transporter substrate-binding protein [Marispirochaeta sp.]
MKRILWSALLLIACGAIVFAGGSKEKSTDLDAIQERGVLIVGLDDSFPPMGFRDESNEIVGFDIDLAKEAASRLGVDVEFKPVDWDGVILSLNKGDIDLVWNGMTITESRQEKINFSKPYLDNRQIVILQADSGISTKADLAGKVVGLQMGSSAEVALNNDAATAASLKEVKKYSNNVEALLDLAAGRSDAVVVDEIVGRYYIAKKTGIYEVMADDFGAETYGVGIRKSDTRLKAELDRVLDEMKADGTADKISRDWFGEAIVKK